jgi:uncharacterized protein YprB with RNaseH-like and TPR domain
MQIFSKVIKEKERVYSPLASLSPLSDILYLDLETTGLSAHHNRIFLIGCAYHTSSGWTITQWFDDTGEGESDILNSFLIFAKPFGTFVHYNGSRFDIPFLVRRIEADRLNNVIANKKSVDLYRMIRPYKKILSLVNYQQQTIERYMGTGRTESRSGAELVELYHQYLQDPRPDLSAPIIAHNEADVRGLIGITPVIGMQDVFTACLLCTKAGADYYTGVDGARHEELILECRMQDVPYAGEILKKPVSATADGCYMTANGADVNIKVPIYREEMKYFYANFRDYYYLPGRDEALHKSIAGFIDKEKREQAKAENCYTRKKGSFLPEWALFREPFFKRSYRDKDAFFEFSDEMKKDRSFFSDYATYIYRHIVGRLGVPAPKANTAAQMPDDD